MYYIVAYFLGALVVIVAERLLPRYGSRIKWLQRFFATRDLQESSIVKSIDQTRTLLREIGKLKSQCQFLQREVDVAQKQKSAFQTEVSRYKEHKDLTFAELEQKKTECARLKERLDTTMGEFEKLYALNVNLNQELKERGERFTLLERERGEFAEQSEAAEIEIGGCNATIQKLQDEIAAYQKKEGTGGLVSQGEYHKLEKTLEEKNRVIARLEEATKELQLEMEKFGPAYEVLQCERESERRKLEELRSELSAYRGQETTGRAALAQMKGDVVRIQDELYAKERQLERVTNLNEELTQKTEKFASLERVYQVSIESSRGAETKIGQARQAIAKLETECTRLEAGRLQLDAEVSEFKRKISVQELIPREAYEALNKGFKEKGALIVHLEEEIKSLKGELSAAAKAPSRQGDAKLKAQDDKSGEKDEALSQLKTLNANLNNDLKEKDKKLEALQQRIQDMSSASGVSPEQKAPAVGTLMAALKKREASGESASKAEYDELKRRYGEKEARVVALESQAESLKSELEKVTAKQLHGKEGVRSGRSRETQDKEQVAVEEIKKSSQLMSEQLLQKEKELEELHVSNLNLRKALNEKSERNALIESSVNELSRRSKELEDATSVRNEQIGVLDKRLEEKEAALKKALAEGSSLEEELNVLKVQLESSGGAVSQLDANVYVYVDQIAELKKMLASKDAKMEKMRQELESVKKEAEAPKKKAS